MCAALARILPHTSASVRLCPCVSMRPWRSTALDAPLLWPCTLSPCAPKNIRAPFGRALSARVHPKIYVPNCRVPLRPAHVVTRSHAFIIAPGSARADCARSLRSCTALVPVHCARARALRASPCTPLVPVQPHTSVSVLKRRCSARVFVCPRSRVQVDLQRPRQPHSNAGCGCAALWQHMLR